MPSAHELIAHNRSTQEVAELIGADWLIYQDLPDLIDAVGGGKIKIDAFDCAVFDGKYVTGDIDDNYLERGRNCLADCNRTQVGNLVNDTLGKHLPSLFKRFNFRQGC